MGSLLSNMGKRRQVISITHLPQIAAKGEQHLYVYKQSTQDGTVSNIKTLLENDRVEVEKIKVKVTARHPMYR